MPRLTCRRMQWRILAAGVLLAVLYDCSVTIIGDGHINYRIRLASALPISEAGAEVYSRPEEAATAVRNYPPGTLQHPTPPTALAGDPFEVRAWVTTRRGGLGWRNSRVQQRYLGVVAVLTDGRRVAKVVELPEVDAERNDDPEVTVRLD